MKDFNWIKGNAFCHRGLHDNKSIPENSLPAFEKAKQLGLGYEYDVYLTLDGKLIVHHDYNLKRSCNLPDKTIRIDTSRLDSYKLMGTQHRIPLFDEVLELTAGDVGMIIEIKPAARSRVEEVCRAVYDRLKDYNGNYCIESFDNRIVDWWVSNHPEVITGQLYDPIFLHTGALKLMKQYRNVDFLALRVDQTRKPYFTSIKSKHQDKLIVAWTVRTPAQLDIARRYADTIIFEHSDKNDGYISIDDALSFTDKGNTTLS